MAVVTSGTAQRDTGHPYRVVSRPVPLSPAMSERDMSRECPVPSRCPDCRWMLVIELLLDPDRKSRALIALLQRLPFEALWHECVDEVPRRRAP